MGKESRRRRAAGEAAAASAIPSRGKQPAASGQKGARRATAAAASAQPTAGWLASKSTTELLQLCLLAIAGLCWLLAHIPGVADWAIPLWVVTGLALGLASPWYALLLTVATVPFLGGATAPPPGEVLRTLAIHAAALRVLADRFVMGPFTGRPVREGPPAWVVLCAAAAIPLYMLTAYTGTAASGGGNEFYQSAIRWVLGGSMAMMSSWIVASHVVAKRQDVLTDVVLVGLVVACLVALAAFFGVPGASLITFPGVINGRLGALGYPTPTAMGVAISLPLAVAAAWRRAPWLALGVIVLALAVIMFTISRGPLIALAAGAVVGVLASGRLDRRIAVSGLLVGCAAAAGIAVMRYGSDPATIVSNFLNASGEDSDRVGTWIAAVQIAAGNPLLGGGWRAVARFGDFASRGVVEAHNVLLHPLAEGGLPLALANAAPILYGAWMAWQRRRTMASYLIAAVVVFLVCGLWDIPQVRSYASVMGGIVMGMAAGPLIGRGASSSTAS